MLVPKLRATLESALYAADLDAAEAFYGGILGLPVLARKPGRHVFFAVGSSVLLVFDPVATAVPPPADAPLPVPTHGATGPGHFCFAVEPTDMDALVGHLVGSGIAVEADFNWPNGARSVYVRDPAGNSIEFADPALWA